jgi:AcrR family transcriptional regulator
MAERVKPTSPAGTAPVSEGGRPAKRAYHAPRRSAAAAATRAAVLTAARDRFERRGWPGTTIAGVAAQAGVSPKTVEAQFGTKAGLLGAAVGYAIRGDDPDTPMTARRLGRAVEEAPDAPALVAAHVPHTLAIASRSARIAQAVESAAPSDPRVAEVWAQMTRNRRFGARWAAELLLAKPGVRPGLTLEQATRTFVVAIDWATYRTLSGELGLDDHAIREWLLDYERRLLLP